MTISRLFRGIFSRLGIWWQSYYIMQTDINIDNVNKKLKEYSKKIPYSIVELNYNDFLKGDKEFCTQKKMNKYIKWFDDNKRKAYGVIINEELAHSSWISFENIEITNKIKLTNFDDYALLQDDYTGKRYRGIGLHNYVNLYRLKMIFEYKKTKAIVIVSTKNIPALKTQIKSGFKISSNVILISIFGFEILKYFEYEDK